MSVLGELFTDYTLRTVALGSASLGLVAGMLGDAISPIDLPDMQGFSLIIDEGGITSVDGDTLLAIYADLAYATPAPKN